MPAEWPDLTWLMEVPTICFMVTFLMMLAHAVDMVSDYIPIMKYEFKPVDVDDPILPFSAVVPLVVTAISMIFFVLALLCVMEPFLKTRKLAMDLTFSFMFSTVSGVFSIIWGYVNPDATLLRLLMCAINTVLLYFIRYIWINLEADLRKQPKQE